MNVAPEVQVFISDVVTKHAGEIKLIPKNSSRLMRAIGWFFRKTRISPAFMDNYYTTIGSTLYIPNRLLGLLDGRSFLRTLAHEAVHVADSRRLIRGLFGFLYLFPQSLAPLALISLLTPLNPMFAWFLLALVFLAPLPAPFRYWFELRAYRVQLLFAKREDGATPEEMEVWYAWIEKQLCTKLYYWTWPFPSMVRRHLKDESMWDTGFYKELSNWIVAKRVAQQIKPGEYQ